MAEKRNGPCDDYPVVAKFKLARGVIERHLEAFNQDGQRQQALGSIAVGVEMISGLTAEVGCGGPRYAEDAYFVCPLQRQLNDLPDLILGPNKNTTAVYDLSAFGDEPANGGNERSGGQYL